MPRAAVTVAITLLGAAVAAVAAAALVVWGGLYDVAADRPHTQAVYTLLETTMRQAVKRRSRHIAEPPLDDAALVRRGAVCFREHCVACHGAPGEAPQPAGLAMQPLPGPLADAPRHWRPREIAWITRHGLRMTGMPAWGGRLGDPEIWAVVGFVQQLPHIVPAQWRAISDALRDERCAPDADGDAERALPLPLATPPAAPPALPQQVGARLADAGRDAIRRHGCHGCHVIPGIVGSPRHVGVPLAGFARRTRIAGGRVAATPENVAAWIRAPQHLDPASAMPALGVGATDARAIAAYLGTLY